MPYVLHLSYTGLELCGASRVSIQFGVSIVFGTVFWAGKCKARVREYAGRKCRESWGPRVPGSLHRGFGSRGAGSGGFWIREGLKRSGCRPGFYIGAFVLFWFELAVAVCLSSFEADRQLWWELCLLWCWV